jgi:hypothetical protein
MIIDRKKYDMDAVTISSKFQMVFPKAICEKSHIKSGAKTHLNEFGNHLEGVAVGDNNEGLGFLRVMSSNNDCKEENRV